MSGSESEPAAPVESMSPLEAAQLLYRMADAAPGNGEDHRLKERAAAVLGRLLNPLQEEAGPPGDGDGS